MWNIDLSGASTNLEHSENAKSNNLKEEGHLSPLLPKKNGDPSSQVKRLEGWDDKIKMPFFWLLNVYSFEYSCSISKWGLQGLLS